MNLTPPKKLFFSWFEEAVLAKTLEPYAANLSTISTNNTPRSRIVFIKQLQHRDFVFFTNLNSAKAQEIQKNKNISLCFFWPNIEKQIRIEGIAELVEDELADLYFKSRDRGKQIGAWSSNQSQILADYNELTDRFKFFEDKFNNQEVPRPPHWSGFYITPTFYEFWTLKQNRLHERLCFKQTKNDDWESFLLNP